MALCVLCPTESAQEQDVSVSVELPLRLQPKAQFFQQLPTGNFQNLSTIISTTTLRSRFGHYRDSMAGGWGLFMGISLSVPPKQKKEKQREEEKVGGVGTQKTHRYTYVWLYLQVQKEK